VDGNVSDSGVADLFSRISLPFAHLVGVKPLKSVLYTEPQEALFKISFEEECAEF
jgi:hypothetical protein